MKTMTCRQLGGPCEQQHHGRNINEIITAQDRHLTTSSQTSDTSHHLVREAMRNHRRRPKESLGWYNPMETAFAKVPTDPA